MIRKNFVILIYLAIVAYAVFLAFEYGFKPHYYKSSNTVVSKNGVLDLTGFSFDSTHLIRLQGDAEFYWKKFVDPNQFGPIDTLNGHFIEIHGVWNGHKIDNQILKGHGYATYRLIIKVPVEAQYGFRFQEFDCAYKVWFNGMYMHEIGKVATNTNEMVPSWKRLEVYVPSKNKQIELVIQISNFHHRKGGPEDAIVFGPEERIKSYKDEQFAIGFALLGILFIMAVYHLVLFFYRPNDYSSLLFGLLNFFMMLRHATTGEKIFLDLFPNVDWLTAVYVEYCSYMLAASIAVGFIYTLYPNYLNRTFVVVSGWVSVISCIFVFVTPSTLFSYSPLVYQVVVLIMAIYLFVAILHASIKKAENSLIILSGYLFFFLTIFNDILYYNKWIGTSFLMPLGLFILVFSQAFVLSKKNSLAFFNVENLSVELEQANKELENRVQKRTEVILEQKEKIEEQKAELEVQAEQLIRTNEKLIELDKFKEEMIGMLVHDLKNPLNVVLHLTENDIVKYAGRQMLILVQNLLDVKKYQEVQMEINLTLNPLSEVVENAIGQISFMIQKKQIELINHINTYGLYYFDALLIERVLINLLSNAAKYTPAEGLIQIDYKNSENSIEISISNNGISIPDDQKELIFLPFGQYNPQKSGYAGSTGLGLTLCKMIVTAHGGKIGVKDHKPQGTTFYFTIPVSENQSFFINEKLPNNTRYQNELIPSQQLNILLTPEDKKYLQTFANQLSEFKIYEVSTLKKILSFINEDTSAGVYLWVKTMKEAIGGIKDELFHELLNVTKT